MPELSLYNIDRITSDIRKQEITYNHLFDDLVDHVCCDVEYEMQNGLSFTEAYIRVKGKIGFRGLKKIQEETLYEVDSKYRKMKNLMKITGVAGAVMLGFAAMFKIFHWPGAGIMLTLGATLLSFVFLPSALIVLWKETKSSKRLFLFISAFLGGVSFILGILFKVQHWPGAGVLISLFGIFTATMFIPTLLVSKLKDEENRSKKAVYIAGSIGFLLYIISFWFKALHWPLAGIMINFSYIILFCIVLPWYTWLEWKDEAKVSTRFIFMVIAVLLFVIPSALINMNLERSYYEGFIFHQGLREAVLGYQEKNNDEFLLLYKDSTDFPVVEKIHADAQNLIRLINRNEWKLFAEHDVVKGLPEQVMAVQITSGNDVPYDLLTQPFQMRLVLPDLLPGGASRKEIEDGFGSFRNTLAESLGKDWTDSRKDLLDPSYYLPTKETEKRGMSLITGLHGLTMLKSSILSLESDALNHIKSH